ncbi:fimbria/pilus chaperone family protein [Dyella sp.]|uniref:fimbria/pilus chaperone family protein n=1 Tax=Dyella sp. TaxID=1869338 RepID=UPI002ED62D73
MDAFKRNASARMRCAAVFFSFLAAAPVSASTFRLESTTIVLDERDARTSFSVTNTGEDPILLLTTIEDLDNRKLAENILINPAIIRIDPGQSQFVNFELKKGLALESEHMLKASFEGVTQRVTHGTVMPMRHEIGFIVQPAVTPVVNKPWEGLRFKQEADHIEINNPGKHVVRLGASLKLQPSGQVVTLEHPYLMPGARVTLPVDQGVNVNGVTVIPLSRYGFTKDPVTLDVTH